MNTYYTVETLHYKSRFDTYGAAVHQAEAMSRITGLPSQIFKAVSVVTSTESGFTVIPFLDNDDSQ